MRNSTEDVRHITERTSASQLKLFKRCPYAFKLKYLVGEKPIFRDPTIFTVGRVVHDTIESYYAAKPDQDDIEDAVRRYFHNLWDVTGKFDKYTMASQCLKHFTDFELLRRSNYDYFPASEKKISAHGFYGIIDYYDKPLKMIIDFKTEKRARLLPRHKLQAAVYNKIMDGNGKVHFYFLQENKILSYNIEDTVNQEVHTTKQDILQALENDDFPISNKCSYCEFSYCCDKSKKITLEL